MGNEHANHYALTRLADSENRGFVIEQGYWGTNTKCGSVQVIRSIEYRPDVTGPSPSAPRRLHFRYEHPEGCFISKIEVVGNEQGDNNSDWSYSYGDATPATGNVYLLAALGGQSDSFPTWQKRIEYDYTLISKQAAGGITLGLRYVARGSGDDREFIEYHYDAEGRVVRSISDKGDYYFKYNPPSSGRTHILYSPPHPPNPLTSGWLSEGYCTDSASLSCDASTPCPTGACKWQRSYLSCVTEADCIAACGAGYNAGCGGGHCYCGLDEVWYDGQGRAISARSAGPLYGGLIWGANGRLEARRRAIYDRSSQQLVDYYFTNASDPKGRYAVHTFGNAANQDTCAALSDPTTDRCKRLAISYLDSGDLGEQDYVKKVEQPGPNGTTTTLEHFYSSSSPKRRQATSVTGETWSIQNDKYVMQTRLTSFGYDSAGRLEWWDESDGPRRTLTYVPSSGQRFAAGQVETLTFDNGSQPLQYQFEYASAAPIAKPGVPTVIEDPNGRKTYYSYDMSGFLVKVERDPPEGVGRYSLIEVISRTSAGKPTLVAYDSGGRCLSIHYRQLSSGAPTTHGKPTRLTRFKPSSPGDCKSTQLKTAEIIFERDAIGRVRKLSGWDLRLVSSNFERNFVYDQQTGHLRRVYGAGFDRRMTRDWLGQLTDAGKEECSDLCGSQLAGCACPRVEFQYNGLGDLISVRRYLSSTPGGPEHLETATFTADGHQKTIAGGSSSRTIEYDGFGRPVKINDDHYGESQLQYDSQGRVVRRRRAVGTSEELTETFSYDSLGRVTVADPAPNAARCSGPFTVGPRHEFSYDSHAECPDGFCGSAKGRLVRVRSEIGCADDAIQYRTTWYSYDLWGRVTKVAHQMPGSSSIATMSYTYDNAGRVTALVLPNGSTRTYSYDVSGLTKPFHVPVRVSLDGRTIVESTGNARNSHTYNATCGGGAAISVSRAFASNGVPVTASASCQGLYEVSYQAVQKAGQPFKPMIASVTSTGPNCGSCRPGDICDEEIGECKSGRSASYSYDEVERLVGAEAVDLGVPTFFAAYFGLKRTELETLDRATRFQEPEHRGINFGSGGYMIADVNGVAIQYDARGRRVQDDYRSYHYYPGGRLMALTSMTAYQRIRGTGWEKYHGEVQSHYTYDYRGRRIAKVVTAGVDGEVLETWRYTYDELTNELILEERTPIHGEPESFEYVYAEGLPVYQRTTTVDGELETFLISNYLGQPMVGFTADGSILYRADVNALGWTTELSDFQFYIEHAAGHIGTQERIPPIHQPLRRFGQYEDPETAVAYFEDRGDGYAIEGEPSPIVYLRPPLFYNWHRYYDPWLGRYVTPDPLGRVDGPNMYAYAGFDGVNRYDPDGRLVFSLIKTLIALNQIQQDFVGDAPTRAVVEASQGEALSQARLGGNTSIEGYALDRIIRERRRLWREKRCESRPLTAADHYFVARDNVSKGGAPAFIKTMINTVLYDFAKDTGMIPVKIPHLFPNDPPTSGSSVHQIAWAIRGAIEGWWQR